MATVGHLFLVTLFINDGVQKHAYQIFSDGELERTFDEHIQVGLPIMNQVYIMIS